MKHTRRRALQIIASLLLPAILSSTLHAAETVRWADLPKKVGKGKALFDGQEDREYMIITKAGETYRSQTLLFGPTDVSLTEPDRSVPSEQVAEIRIRHRMRWTDAFLAPPAIGLGALANVFSSGELGIGPPPPEDFLLLPLALGVGLAAAPFVAVIEGTRRLVPARALKVKP
jgi:hypothetical protein